MIDTWHDILTLQVQLVVMKKILLWIIIDDHNSDHLSQM